jgi:signal transduction histidine kinase
VIVNAIKYTPDRGTITISGHNHPETNQVEVVVRDTGIGIETADLELIFEKFYRTDSAELHSSGRTNFKGGGPGLGLAIARGIIQAHSGKIWAESQGHNEETLPGSRFHVLLPVQFE